MTTVAQHPQLSSTSKPCARRERDTTLRQLAAKATERYAGRRPGSTEPWCRAQRWRDAESRRGQCQSGTDARWSTTCATAPATAPTSRARLGGRCKHRFAVCLVKKAGADAGDANITRPRPRARARSVVGTAPPPTPSGPRKTPRAAWWRWSATTTAHAATNHPHRASLWRPLPRYSSGSVPLGRMERTGGASTVPSSGSCAGRTGDPGPHAGAMPGHGLHGSA